MRNSFAPALAVLKHNYFLLALSAAVISLMFLGVFDSVNLLSISLSIAVGITLAERIPYLPARVPTSGALDKIATALLVAVGFEIVFSSAGRGLFPIVYAAAPIVFLYMGWHGALTFISVTALLMLTTYEPSAPPILKLAALPVAAFLPHYLFDKIKKRLPKRRTGEKLSSPSSVVHPLTLGVTSVTRSEEDAFHSMEGGRTQPAKEYDPLPSAADEPFRSAFDMLAHLISFNTAVLYLKREDGFFEIEDFVSHDQTPIDTGQRMHFRSGYLGWAFKTRTPLVVGNIKNPGENLIYYSSKNEDIGSLIVFPLLDSALESDPSSDDVMGFLVIDSRLENAFEEYESITTAFIAESIVEKAKLIGFAKQAQKHSQSLATFYELSRKLGSTLEPETITDAVIESLAEIMESEFIGISLREDEGSTSVLYRTGPERIEAIEGMKIPHSNTLVGLVADTGKYFFTPDLSARQRFKEVFGKEIDFALRMQKTKSLLIVPLHDNYEEDKTANACVVISKSTPNAFTTDQRKLAKIISRDAAGAISNSVSYRKARELAVTDSLTGLYNLRKFTEELSCEIEHHVESSIKLSVLLIDIDRFKQFNDTLGHQVGDVAIKAVADAITEATRNSDIAARYGGDEFAVLLKNENHKHAKEIASRIIRNVKNTQWNAKGIEMQPTVSIGISTFPDNAYSKEILLRNADRALYKAKRIGRNTFVHFEEMEEGA